MKSNLSLWNLILVIFLFSCTSKKIEEHTEIEFPVTTPLIKDTAVSKEYVCQIRAIQHIELRVLEKGYLQSIYVDEGQAVRSGQNLFQIKPIIYSSERDVARAEVNYANKEYSNTKALADKDVVSKNELALARAKLEKARAELDLAQAHLSFTNIRAPFSGYIGRFQARKGSLMDEGDLLTTLADNSRMWVYFNVQESEYLDFQKYSNKEALRSVKLRMANGDLFPFDGRVETIEADFNNETGNIAFRANFPNPERLLRHGETGNVLVRFPYASAMLIPQKSTYEILDKIYVFVVDNNNVVHSREIKIAAELEDVYVVQSGLGIDDRIILEGLRKVQDGDKIKSKYMDPYKVMSNLKTYAE